MIKIFKKNLVYNIKNLSIFSIFNLIKIIIKIITRLSSIFGFSVLIYFDTSILPNIYNDFMIWFKNFKISNLYEYYHYLCDYLNNFLIKIKALIKSNFYKDKPIDNSKSIYDINSKVDIGDYQLNRKDYEEKTNLQKYLGKNYESKNNNSFYSFISSPYFYVPCIIILTIGGGFIVYHYWPIIGNIKKGKDELTDFNNDILNNNQMLPKADEVLNNSPITLTPSDSLNNNPIPPMANEPSPWSSEVLNSVNNGTTSSTGSEVSNSVNKAPTSPTVVILQVAVVVAVKL